MDSRDSFEDIKRQLRVALIAIAVVFPLGIIGYMLIEDMSFSDSVWLTIITLGTVGYGDVIPHSDEGRIFTIFLLLFGIGAFAVLAQAAVQFFVSPAIRDIRLKNRAERKIRALKAHYIICGKGALVDKTVDYILGRAELRRIHQTEALTGPIERALDRVFGTQRTGLIAQLHRVLTRFFVGVRLRFHSGATLLDAVVVVTDDAEYAETVRSKGLLVINDDPTDDAALMRAGIDHASASISVLENDTETILSVLTMRARSQSVFITATTLSDLGIKMTRVGANNVLAPYDVAGQFLNNATLRPAVNDYFNSILFDHQARYQLVQLFLWDTSDWIGQRLGDLPLREALDTGIIGLRTEDGDYVYAPNQDYVLGENEVLLVVAPGSRIPELMEVYQESGAQSSGGAHWQKLPQRHMIQTSEKTYSIRESEDAINTMASHYIICGSGPTLRYALDKLNPERPFAVVSNDQPLVTEMLKRGFRVVMGDTTDEATLLRAGVDRALAIMISIGDPGDAVHTVLNCRTLNRNLLITATAGDDELIPKLRRAGADRVVSPFRIAAQFVILSTTNPVASDFLQYVLFNYQAGLETTEIYMQDDSPWIGKKISDLLLERIFRAGVIGVRGSDGIFIYAPSQDHVIRAGEVLIIIVPMRHSDDLRTIAHGGEDRRPRTLRTHNVQRTMSGINTL